VTDVLTQRALNRATLARQYLLERAPVRAIDAIEHLGGMQSQAPLAPYVGLWTRLRDFAPAELATLTEEREVARLQLMRNTVHLVSKRDGLGWRALFTRLQAAEFRANFRDGIKGADQESLLRQAGRLLAERPRTRAELGLLLAERWPGADPRALGYTVTLHLALCQVPPRGVWGKAGPATWAPLEDWLGAPLRSAPVDDLVDDLVLRYLGAFGPASVADVQAWSGLTRLREVVERLPVRTFRGEAGQALHDLPDDRHLPDRRPVAGQLADQRADPAHPAVHRTAPRGARRAAGRSRPAVRLRRSRGGGRHHPRGLGLRTLLARIRLPQEAGRPGRDGNRG
jgi:Winged helix DNA-binding domain